MKSRFRLQYLRDRRVVAALFIPLIIALYFLCWKRRGDKVDETAEAAEVEAVVATAMIQPFAVTVSSIGVVEPRPGAYGRIAAPAATRVKRVLVAEGDHVLAGQALIELDAAVFDAQAQQARAAFDQAERALARQTRLQAEGIAPRKDVEAAAADLSTARAALVEAQRIQSLAILRSPLSGIVGALDVALAQPVDANESLVEVVDPARLEIMFHAAPGTASRIVVGSRVELSTGSRTAGWLGAGVVRGVGAVLDSVSHSVEIRVSPTGETRVMRVGESINGRIVVATHPRAVVVPTAALVPDEDGVHVFVVDSAGIAHATPVTVGERNDDLVEVAAGLRGGERVVTTGAYGVSDGAHIVRHKARKELGETSP